MFLAGDIGGTKTVLGVFSAEFGTHKPLLEKTYPSAQYDGLEEIVRIFLDSTPFKVDRACFGVAGPIIDGVAKITNLTWVISSTDIKAEFGWSEVTLLNDLESVAYSVPILKPDDVETLNVGKPVPDGPIAVLALGTGLGEAYLTYDDGHYHAHASEGSHASFAPMDQLQVGLLTFLREQRGFEHVSFERVCSGGLGIPNIYDYLKTIGYAPEPAWLAEKISKSDDPTPIIFQAAQDQTNPSELCIAVIKLLVAILGAEVGNLAIKVLSTGGIYLGGGIAPRILTFLKTPLFLDGVSRKGRFRELLKNMPIHVILNEKVGLMGAAEFCLALNDQHNISPTK